MTTEGRDLCTEPHNWGPVRLEQWLHWANRMRETHTQSRCPDCGLEVVWRLRDAETAEPEQAGLFDSEGAQ